MPRQWPGPIRSPRRIHPRLLPAVPLPRQHHRVLLAPNPTSARPMRRVTGPARQSRKVLPPSNQPAKWQRLRHPCHERKHQCHGSISANARILHDLQTSHLVAPAEKTISDVRQSILMQSAACGCQNSNRQDRRQKHGQVQQRTGTHGKDGGQGSNCPCQRESADGHAQFAIIAFKPFGRDWQTGEKSKCAHHVTRQRFQIKRQ